MENGKCERPVRRRREKKKGNDAKLVSRIFLGFQSKQQIANFD